MALKETIKQMKDLLAHITTDLEKADGGNKAASQRVRTGTVKLEKVAKVYRKDSIKHEKSTQGTKKTAKKAAGKSTAKKAAKPAAKATANKSVKVKAKPKAKAHKAVAKPRAMSLKRPTAKLPSKRASFR